MILWRTNGNYAKEIFLEPGLLLQFHGYGDFYVMKSKECKAGRVNDHFFSFMGNLFFGIDFAICDLVHNVETIFHLR